VSRSLSPLPDAESTFSERYAVLLQAAWQGLKRKEVDVRETARTEKALATNAPADQTPQNPAVPAPASNSAAASVIARLTGLDSA